MINEVLKSGRICLKPTYWSDFYKLLQQVTGKNDIPKPLILAGWNFTSDEEKLSRFKEHLTLVDFNSDNPLTMFLNGLTEENWHHNNE